MASVKKKYLNLYQKFVLVVILVGILPIALLATVIMNRMFGEYTTSLEDNYSQGLRYARYSMEQLFESYNNISKFSYYYSYSSEGSFFYAPSNYDNLRKILTGEGYSADLRAVLIQQNMSSFLRNVLKINSSIEAAHFIYLTPDQEIVGYHEGNTSNRFQDESLFLSSIGFDSWETESRDLIIIPAHSSQYIKNNSRSNNHVFTAARNYYDLTGVVGKEKYVGTLVLDFDTNQIKRIFEDIDLYTKGTLYICNENGDCFYSSDKSLIGINLITEQIPYNKKSGLQHSLFYEELEQYGLQIYFQLKNPIVDSHIRNIQRVMYLIIGLAVIALSIGSMYFSRRLTKPMHTMMHYMADIENGRFKREIPVTSHDEIGELSARFNEMSRQLEIYTNQAYVAKIKQKEGELTALKSQIYPHFLYNTLEVIRMTAISNQDEMVAKMVEALGDQIRYLIGTVGDIVPLSKEIFNLQQYIYLLNCRYNNKIIFSVQINGLGGKMLPKLSLQPIVENAFIHGIKLMENQGHIQLTAEVKDKILKISVMDNGRGMDSQTLRNVEHLLESDQPGKRTESGWESIGLKNVHDRIRYLYGSGNGVTIFSSPNIGTVVTITIPNNIDKEDSIHAENDTGR